eukprot:gene5734-7918_t
MGNGVSNLSEEQKIFVTNEMTKKMEEYNEAGISPEKAQLKLTEDFNRYVSSLTAPTTTKVVNKKSKDMKNKIISPTNGSAKVQPPMSFREPEKFDEKSARSRQNNLSDEKVQKTAAQRRKSYDMSLKKKIGSVDLATIAESVSAPILEESKEAVDSWDSVSTQPFCHACRMAFKSFAFLDRHVNYSDLHIKNVKQREDDKAKIMAEQLKLLQDALECKFSTQQIEGIHYKLLYAGSKLYWQSSTTVDFHFYHHILSNAIEVTTFDSLKHKELNRIYLDYQIISEIAGNSDKLESIKADVLREIASDRFASIPNDEFITDEAKIRIIDTFLLQRLQLSNIGYDADFPVNSVVFLPLITDNLAISPLLEDQPSTLVPVSINRRRKSNTEEINAVITGLSTDRAAVKESTSKAERISNLIHAGAYYFGSNHWWSSFRLPRRRWIWAIRLVIRKKHVQQTREMLENMKFKLAAQESVKRRRNSRFSITPLGSSKEI